ncbi:MAG: ABC transporter ATP-binding protein [Agathobacter sp.]|nr:ABC transporter ATP-binding protein [Agathobacter sp.]
MIQIKNVHKSFGDKEVLKGIDINIEKGEIFGLLGPSGAGKTTLIKIITEQIEYDKGEVIGNEGMTAGIMMDNFGLYSRLSCIDNLKIFADIYGLSYDKAKEALEQVGLGKEEKTVASKLSKGMKCRLQLARAIMQSPDIIFLDEPTSGLDPATSKAMHKLIIEKKNQGCTIFLTTHDMEEATKLCDHVALLNEGKIVEYGVPKEVCRKYNHKKSIVLHLHDGSNLELPHQKESAEKISQLLLNDEIETIHSSEPNLETVFLELTGRKLQEEEE